MMHVPPGQHLCPTLCLPYSHPHRTSLSLSLSLSLSVFSLPLDPNRACRRCLQPHRPPAPANTSPPGPWLASHHFAWRSHTLPPLPPAPPALAASPVATVRPPSETKNLSGLTARPVLTSYNKNEQFKNRPYDPYHNYTSPTAAILSADAFQSMYAQMVCGLCQRHKVLRVSAVFASGLQRTIRFLQLNWKELPADIEAAALSHASLTRPCARRSQASSGWTSSSPSSSGTSAAMTNGPASLGAFGPTPSTSTSSSPAPWRSTSAPSSTSLASISPAGPGLVARRPQRPSRPVAHRPLQPARPATPLASSGRRGPSLIAPCSLHAPSPRWPSAAPTRHPCRPPTASTPGTGPGLDSSRALGFANSTVTAATLACLPAAPRRVSSRARLGQSSAAQQVQTAARRRAGAGASRPLQ
ncbi:hypothetical protein VPH35_042427 [Triticum aestivum]